MNIATPTFGRAAAPTPAPAPAPPARSVQFGLMPKVLLVFVPIFVVLTLLSTRMLLEYGRGQERDALAVRIGTLTGRVALAVGATTRGTQPADPKLLRSLLGTLSGEPAFLCAEVLASDGTRMAAWPAIGCDAMPGPADETRANVPLDRGPSPGVTAGSVRVRYTDTSLRESSTRLGLLLLAGGVSSFVVALLALWLAYRFWVAPPIARLLGSIRSGARGEERQAVKWEASDEMGQIVAAYNELVAREAAREFSLRGLNASLRGMNRELEARVQSRTMELQASEARLRSIIDTVADGIITADEQGIIRSVSRAAAAIFKTPPGALIGRPLSVLLVNPGADTDLLVGARRRRLPGKRGDNSQFPMDVQIEAVPEANGALFTLCVRDVTVQLEYEDGLKLARDAAQRADRAKSDFLAVITHELRTPLNGVIGMTGLLLDSPLDTQARRYAETLRDAGEHLLQLINDVLDFTKLEANRLSYEEILLEPEHVVQSAIELMQPRARAKGLTLETAIDPSAPGRVRGDPGRLRQVLMNLISNAVKFTEQGHVRVTVAAEPGGPPAGGGAAGEADLIVLRFSVSDTGIGIAPENLPKLFMEFSQIDSSISRRFGGTGLGLAICRKLVAGMGGEVTAQSVVGQGSTFSFTVRVRAIPPAEPIQKPERKSRAGVGQTGRPSRSMRVLVAEDNQTNQIVIRAMVGKLGHRADLVGNGIEAVEAMRTRPYDLVLMDVMMPEMDGMEATRRIRALPAPAGNIPIFGLTAHAAAAEHDACLQAGMLKVITKPVTIGALGEAMGEIADALPAS